MTTHLLASVRAAFSVRSKTEREGRCERNCRTSSRWFGWHRLCWLCYLLRPELMPSIVSYNVLSAAQNDRYDDIFLVFKKSLCICLQGTRLTQSNENESYRYEHRAGFHHILFPVKKGGNAHAGLSIAVNSALVEKEQIVQVVAPQYKLLQGRVAGIRIKTSTRTCSLSTATCRQVLSVENTRQTSFVWSITLVRCSTKFPVEVYQWCAWAPTLD
eukprot:TRINITY_DN21243_c0_g1_i1.p1 TRINITY_DN21243_c0_g1~~TRINITY_DN21243_c0_g1_i1.p1  ORF type:complete len:215 (-),score=5.72 TRINITY_DN21243_c0_g1_i1:678-1322(-)